MEYSFCFGRINDGIILKELINIVFGFSNLLEFSFSIVYNTSKVKSLHLKNKKFKKVGKKMTTKKLFEKVVKRIKMSRNINKTQMVI